MIQTEKGEIRKEITRRLREQEAPEREEKSRNIQQKLLSSGEFESSGTIMSYVSMPTEVDTWSFIKEAMEKGKRVAVPYIGPDKETITASELRTIEDLEQGPFGIYQPKEAAFREILLKEIDLIVVPAIAYDRKNMRLGRGKGYYDRFLAQTDLSSADTIGLAFSFQIVDSLPSDPHDRPVSRVITD